ADDDGAAARVAAPRSRGLFSRRAGYADSRRPRGRAQADLLSARFEDPLARALRHRRRAHPTAPEVERGLACLRRRPHVTAVVIGVTATTTAECYLPCAEIGGNQMR